MDEVCRQMDVRNESELRETPSFLKRREFLLAQEVKKHEPLVKLTICLRAFISRLGWKQ